MDEQIGFDLDEPEAPKFVGSHAVRLELHELLETAKAARSESPWDASTLRHHRNSFPIKAKVLPPEEATFLWRQFELELERIETQLAA
ncbi:hypothetical protein [uncultured Parasphingopyxis sp.]|uniref:hypothetical protein n=1 Tax=uncultured Parasphingopyxis sp. TaxID=1547918 RepID=UPI00260DCD63|nr:hypothetical protein [uncultured Parasphingopyxis sp.]